MSVWPGRGGGRRGKEERGEYEGVGAGPSRSAGRIRRHGARSTGVGGLGGWDGVAQCNGQRVYAPRSKSQRGDDGRVQEERGGIPLLVGRVASCVGWSRNETVSCGQRGVGVGGWVVGNGRGGGASRWKKFSHVPPACGFILARSHRVSLVTNLVEARPTGVEKNDKGLPQAGG